MEQGECIVEIFADNKHQFEATELLKQAITFSKTPVTRPPLIADIQMGDLASV